MTKYKWSLLGLIVSIILFLIFLINPIIDFNNSKKFITSEPLPDSISFESSNPLEKYMDNDSFEDFVKREEKVNKDYKEWYKNVPKKFNWHSLDIIWKSFYHWNLFWIPIIAFSFMAFNYKKSK